MILVHQLQLLYGPFRLRMSRTQAFVYFLSGIESIPQHLSLD